MRSKAKVKTKVEPVIDKDGARIYSTLRMMETLHEYFALVFTTEDTGHVPDGESIFKGMEADKVLDFEFMEEMVRAKVLKLQADKSAGINDMSP
jgi:hypothetical protein